MITVPTVARCSTPVFCGGTKPVEPAPVAPAATVSLSPQAVAAAQSKAPAVSTDHDFSKGARAAAIIGGVIGGAAVATAVAYGCAMGGMNLGSFVTGSLFREVLPRAIGLTNLASYSNMVVTAAPILGGLAGGIIGGIAGKQKPAAQTSDTPGSGLAKLRPDHRGIATKSLGYVGYTWEAAKTSMRGAGEKAHQAGLDMASAPSFGDSVKAGARGGYAFGSRVGNVGGRAMGLVQGACLGAMLTGAPFAFSPLTTIPVAIIGAVGVGTAMSVVGGVVGGSLAAAGGAVMGAASYGIRKAIG